jgi:ankyrin repeat protein
VAKQPAPAAADVRRAVEAIRANEISVLKDTLAVWPALGRQPALAQAAAGGARLEALRLLQRHGVDWNAARRGYRPLHALIQSETGRPREPSKDELACLDFLLEHGADPEQLGAFPAMRAVVVGAMTGVPAFVDRLIAHGAKVDGFVAAAVGDLDRVRTTLGADPGFARARDQGVLTALQCAVGSRLGLADEAVRGRLHAIARALLDAGADPNARTKSWSDEVDVAYFAVGVGDRASLELLLDRGADPTSALWSAVWRDLGLAELLLARGGQPDHAHENGRPLLNELIRWGQVTPALWLLERGASPNLPDARGWTAVHQAASRGNARLLRAVLEAGGDRSRKDQDGGTPLDVARSMRRFEMAEILRTAGSSAGAPRPPTRRSRRSAKAAGRGSRPERR